jgi:PKD repeat protein
MMMNRQKIFLVVLFALMIPLPAVQGTAIDGVQVFPPDHIWNVPVDQLPVDPRSADYVSRIGTTKYLHPDFGSGLYEGAPMGIPYNSVNRSVPKQTVVFDYEDESDPGPYPVPANPLIEGGGGSDGDRHLLMLSTDEKVLYELYAAEKQPDGTWHAGSGAVFDLNGYGLRPDGWTSTDAAGLAVLPGLVRYEEVAAGKITHAIRFTAPKTQRAYVWPARHYASSITDPAYPPMGQRFRLKASFDTSGYPYQARVILEALKKYGMILSDNGGAWYITGSPDDGWNNDALHTLQQVKGSDFEAVDESSLMINPDSGRARTSSPVPVVLPGQETAPADPDHDGLYEDLNGSGEAGFSDVVLFFKHIDWILANEPVTAFDFSGNGEIGFQDIVSLFKKI